MSAGVCSYVFASLPVKVRCLVFFQISDICFLPCKDVLTKRIESTSVLGNIQQNFDCYQLRYDCSQLIAVFNNCMRTLTPYQFRAKSVCRSSTGLLRQYSEAANIKHHKQKEPFIGKAKMLAEARFLVRFIVLCFLPITPEVVFAWARHEVPLSTILAVEFPRRFQQLLPII